MMNQDIKAKWVAALRSGEYTQASDKLKSERGHCCLGVLCEISKLEIGFGVTENLEENAGCQTLSYTVLKWAKMPNSDGAMVSINGIKDLLTKHNDDGKTFIQIADAIEAQL